MDLVLTDEQRMIRDAATQFFRERGGVARARAVRDGTSDGPQVSGQPGSARPSDQVWGQLADLGWLAMTVPERFDGAGLGLTELCLVTEAAGRVLAPEPLVAATYALDLIAMTANVPARDRWLTRIIEGAAFATVAADERAMRGDLARTATEARPIEEGFALHGDKCDVIGANEADLLIVSAVNAATRHVDLYAVDPKAEGVTLTRQHRIDGRSCARVTLAGVNVASTDHIGDVELLARARDRATVALASELLGTATTAFEMTLAYLTDRQQFGVAIGTFQALRHRAARLYIGLALARSAVMAAARLADAQAAGAPEGSDPKLVAQTISLAKARVSDTALHVGDEAIQMHGGIGMTDEHDIGLYYKRIRVAATTFGDGAYHRDRWATLAAY